MTETKKLTKREQGVYTEGLQDGYLACWQQIYETFLMAKERGDDDRIPGTIACSNMAFRGFKQEWKHLDPNEEFDGFRERGKRY